MPIVYPSVEWIQQNPAIDPSGHRHEKNSTFGFLKTVGTGPGGQLDFGAVSNAFSSQLTDTLLVYARPSTLGSASGVFNMKFFLASISAWGAGSYRFLERKQLHFNQNLKLTQADVDTPTTVPTSPNLVGTIAPFFSAGQPYISGVLDQGVSEYIYLATFVNTNVPPTQYGGPGNGGFRYRLMYDF